ncbi:MAG: hypothetical protein J6P93_01125 [Alphaproteobacteria bacterium]|nr:hypothetical protein [Alphaproteobacteria bacterium]
MQITLIRHGMYDKSTGHITRDGIEEGIGAGLVLGNATDPKLPDFLDNEPGFGYRIPVAQDPLEKPDLILMSPSIRAKETGFAFLEQLKRFDIEPEVKNNVSYLNDLDLFTDGYKPDHHGCITNEMAESLYSAEPIQKTVDLIQRMAKEGKEHIVIISHQPNIDVLLKLLGNDSLYNLSGGRYYAPEYGVAYTLLDVNPEKIGQEKYQLQIRNTKPTIRNAYFVSLDIAGLSVLPIDYVEWYMPDFARLDKENRIKNARSGGKERE